MCIHHGDMLPITMTWDASRSSMGLVQLSGMDNCSGENLRLQGVTVINWMFLYFIRSVLYGIPSIQDPVFLSICPNSHLPRLTWCFPRRRQRLRRAVRQSIHCGQRACCRCRSASRRTASEGDFFATAIELDLHSGRPLPRRWCPNKIGACVKRIVAGPRSTVTICTNQLTLPNIISIQPHPRWLNTPM